MAPPSRTRFKNVSPGIVGVVKYTPKGEERAMVVQPGESVLLTKDEVSLTANAPKRPEDNPFADQEYVTYNDIGEVAQSGSRPLLVPIDEDRVTPKRGRQSAVKTQAVTPKEEVAAVGSFAEGEETGTPV